MTIEPDSVSVYADALSAAQSVTLTVPAGTAAVAAQGAALFVETLSPEIDVEDFVIAYLAPLIAGGAVAGIAARMPDAPVLPFILVQRVAGADDYVFDHATVSVHSFSDTQTSASDVARAAHHLMRGLGPKTNVTMPDGSMVNATRIEFVETPMWRDYDDPLIMRYVARYDIDVRTPAIDRF